MGDPTPGPPPPTPQPERQRAPGGHVTIKSADPKERATRGSRDVLAQVRRLERGEVIALLLGSGTHRQWRVVHEALKRGTALRLGALEGRAEWKRRVLSAWCRAWKAKYPVLALVKFRKVDEDTLDVYFIPFEV